MGWFSSKTVDDVFDSKDGLLTQVGSWIGNKDFTSEEVAEMNTQTYVDVRKFVVDTLSESTGRSKARRSIAVLVIRFYLLILFMAGCVYPIDATWSAMWINIATSWTLGGLVTSISVFFFGSHALAKHQEGKKK